MPSVSVWRPNDGPTQPSPWAAARANEAGASPPINTFGRPGGNAGIGPEAAERSPAQTRRIVSSVASNVAPRPASGASLAA